MYEISSSKPMNAATDRLDIRLLPDQKRVLARAAQLQGLNLETSVDRFLVPIAA